MSAFPSIVLQKSFWGGERKFLEPLMRFTRGDVRAQPYQPSPIGLSGRPAHCPFRGLLSVYSRYGLHTRAVTNA
jgi:hypothetical protein